MVYLVVKDASCAVTYWYQALFNSGDATQKPTGQAAGQGVNEVISNYLPILVNKHSHLVTKWEINPIISSKYSVTPPIYCQNDMVSGNVGDNTTVPSGLLKEVTRHEDWIITFYPDFIVSLTPPILP